MSKFVPILMEEHGFKFQFELEFFSICAIPECDYYSDLVIKTLRICSYLD